MRNTLYNARDWIDERFPLMRLWNDHLAKYYAPKNFNFWYYFGSLALVVLVIQILSGIWLAMFYVPTPENAFGAVESIMRDVPFGWLLRYIHSTGASAFFVVVYLHMFRSLLYGSHKKPRELVWLVGAGLYVLLLAEAFMGYLLPWGQMSFWAAQVITSLLGAIPVIGSHLVIWLRGDYAVSGATLNRFFALHVVAVPLLMLGLVWMHITALHKVGSNNPDGIDIKKKIDEKGVPLDGIPFHPYYSVKDLAGIGVFLLIFCAILFFDPTFHGYFLEADNFVPANPLQTPNHIAPVWYMTPFYAMLRAIPNKLAGVMTMAGAIAILFILPWLDRSPVRSLRYRSWVSRTALALFVISFIGLGHLGMVPITANRQLWAQIFTIMYFLFFLAMPFYTRRERVKPLPERLT